MGSKAGQTARLFAALGDETRLRLVWRLCREGPLSITALTAGAKVSRQAVAKHLRVMEEAGLARGTRRGRESIWQLEQRRLREAQRDLGAISQRWDDVLARPRAFVERGEGER